MEKYTLVRVNGLLTFTQKAETNIGVDETYKISSPVDQKTKNKKKKLLLSLLASFHMQINDAMMPPNVCF